MLTCCFFQSVHMPLCLIAKCDLYLSPCVDSEYTIQSGNYTAIVVTFNMFFQVGPLGLFLHQVRDHRTLTRNNIKHEITVFDVYDNTGHTVLNVWNAHLEDIKEGQCYEFDTLKTRKNGDVTILTTTPKTEISSITNVKQPTILDFEPIPQLVLSGKPKGMLIQVTACCVTCKNPQKNYNPQDPFHTCDNCEMRQSTKDDYRYTYTGPVLISSPIYLFSLSLSLVSKFILSLSHI